MSETKTEWGWWVEAMVAREGDLLGGEREERVNLPGTCCVRLVRMMR